MNESKPNYIELQTISAGMLSDDFKNDVEGNCIHTASVTPTDYTDHLKNIFAGNWIIIETQFVGSWDWTEEELCMVCKLPLRRSYGAGIVQCPFCGSKAHKQHLFDWLRIRRLCPFCRRELSERSVLSLK